MTIEAAIALPLFVICILSVIFLFRVLELQQDVEYALQYAARKSAIHAHMTHESGLESVVPIAEAKILFQRKLEELKAPVIYVEGEEKGFSFWRSELMGNDIDLCVSYRIENPLQLLGLFSYDMDQRAKVHKWIGYTGGGNEDGTYVYITETGKSYHWFSDCTYLDLSILAVPEETVSGLRNDSGAKYKDCEKCRIGKKDTKTVFVTEYGEAVHNSLSCSGLKRTVYRILLEEAGNHSSCGKCEKRKAS
ncbi:MULTISPECIES: TadE family protein [unclassified Roseburia]|uniref:TadE family protein n=1 Tax=unclassified Roseburia TaxID=2637578 RepID=UPI000E4FCE44|nr:MULTISPECIES: TadE family protein [unclassified Roseburia]RGI46826.1 pilus assembly protein [Roseburia sp. OM03-7AC]RGI49208.1 pilus assembly protein [Roseburia sp. OM03-18]